jgi:hypothetical protein
VTTRCPTICDDDCELGPARCHERHMVATQRDHDPEECERQRAALDELARLGQEIGDAPLVCMSHWRFEPCRAIGGNHRLSSDPEDVLRVALHRLEVPPEIAAGVNSPCPCCGNVSFKCPCCGMVSHNPLDAGNGQCGQCCWYTGDPVLGPFHLQEPCQFRETPARGLPQMLAPGPCRR